MRSNRCFTLLMALVITVGLFASCEKVNNDMGVLPSPSATADTSTPNATPEDTDGAISFPLSETLEFSYWTTMQSATITLFTTLSEHRGYQELERRANVKIDFVIPAAGTESEEFGLMIVSGTYEDVIDTAYHNKGLGDLLVNEIIIDLTDLAEQYMPNYLSIVNSNSQLQKDVVVDSGQRAAIYSIFETVPLNWRGLAVRQDLLDQAGLSLPETYQEWGATLESFRDMGVEKPLYIANDGSSENNFEPGFGIGMRLYVDNGVIKYGPNEVGYKEYVEQMENWYARGLIDPEFMSTSGTFATMGIPDGDPLVRGEIGATNIYSAALGSLMADNGSTEIEDFYLTAAKLPVMNKGDAVEFSKINGSGLAGVPTAITVDCDSEKVPVILQFFDYLFTDEIKLLANYGIEGWSFEYDDNGVPHYTKAAEFPVDGVERFGVYGVAFNCLPFMQIDKEIIQGRAPEIIEMQQRWVSIGTPLSVLPGITMTDEELTTATAIMSDANTYVAEMTAKFIAGIEPMSKYETFLKTLRSMHIEQALSVYQSAVDRYLAR